MIALQITSMKNFMNHLLVADTFDPFLLEEATVSTALTVTIDGHINKDFYPAEERSADCIPWELQSWSKIKGLNIRYDGEKTVLTTGCAYQVFTMDKSADTAWDKALKKYLDLKGISYEEL